LLLTERGLCSSRPEAVRLILAGKVRVGGAAAGKPGSLVPVDAALEVAGPAHPYVSRGGVKLQHALATFGVDPRGRVCLDVGASTGGFTDCLLQAGARLVIAVDVGYGQLADRLRQDPRVQVMERTNIRYLEPSGVPASPDLVAIDVSFISLRLVLPAVRRLLAPPAEVVALVKPQFEVGRGAVGKGGVVRDPALHRSVLEELAARAAEAGLFVWGLTASPLLGPRGNREFWLHLRPEARAADLPALVTRVLGPATGAG
jgi:23S rRNA (cytidine1920-2'-O)/16S rRNA (cytidine1409-2'-O)-methyltransferase